MARIRSIHPGLLTDEAFMALTVEAPLAITVYLGLLMEADDSGAFEWKPLTIKARILPAPVVEIGPLLALLVQHRFIRQYEIGGRQYGAVRNFTRFQRPKKPNAVHPLTDEIRNWVGIGTEPVGNQFGTVGENPPQMEDGGGRKEEEPSSLRSEDAPRVSADAEPAAASPEKPIVEILFGSCLRYLTSNGVPDKSARSVIGKWRRDYGDGEVAAAIGEAQKDAASEPVPLVTAILQRRREARARGSPGRSMPYSNAALARSLLQDIDHEHDSADPGRNGTALHGAKGHREPGAGTVVPPIHLRLAGPDEAD